VKVDTESSLETKLTLISSVGYAPDRVTTLLTFVISMLSEEDPRTTVHRRARIRPWIERPRIMNQLYTTV
jgi:hypothetical protein